MMPCACGRDFVPDIDLYTAHVQTPEHQAWRLRMERGGVTDDVAREELFGLKTTPSVARRELAAMRKSGWRGK